MEPDGIWNGSNTKERKINTNANTGNSEDKNSEPSEIGSI